LHGAEQTVVEQAPPGEFEMVLEHGFDCLIVVIVIRSARISPGLPAPPSRSGN